MRMFYFSLLLFIGFISDIYAFFEKDIRILTMQNGLADNRVACVHKDQNGFMWFGTDNGLSRYDGKNIKNFQIPGYYLQVSHIRETSNDLLWLISSDSIVCFDRQMENFVPVVHPESVRDILFPKDGSAWTFTPQALYQHTIRYEKDVKGNLISICLDQTQKVLDLTEEEAPFNAFCSSPQGDIYLSTNRGQVFIVNATDRKLMFKSSVYKTLNTSRLLYHNGLLWFANNRQGVVLYDPETNSFRQYNYVAQDRCPVVSHTDIYQIVPINEGRYVAVSWNGYTVFTPDGNDRLSFTTTVYNNTASEVHRNIENRMISAYYDPSGVLWVGTSGGGVLASDLRLQFYQKFYQDTHNEIGGIIKDKEGFLWLATYHQGIMKSEKPFHPQEKLSFQPAYVLPSSPFICACEDQEGDLWFGGHDGVLVYYKQKEKKFVRIPIRLDHNTFYKGLVAKIFADKENRLWLGTSQGLLLYEKETGKVTRYKGNFGQIYTLAESAGHLWIGSTKGLQKFNLTDRTITQTGYEEKAGLEVRTIRSLLASTENKLYIGYSGGFGVMDIASDSISYFYTTREGLSNNSVGCIMEDGNGDIWLGNNSSISRYSRHQKLFYNYYVSGNNCSVLWYDSYLFWGNNMNLTYFEPIQVKHHMHTIDQVKITQIEVDNKPVGIGEKINGQTILKEGVPYTKTLTLNQQNNQFSLSFSNLTFSEELQKYMYRLLPLQSEWIVVDEGERASFTNLAKGNYLFEVKSIFPDGSSGEVTTLAITLLPHWYETVTFRFLVFLFLSACVYLLYWWLKKKQERIAQEEKLKHELVVANLEREKEKQIHQERENFFTNVSHELRTPLTLILSPLQELIQGKADPTEIQEKLSLIYGNAKSLSSLTDQLLYVQKIEAGMVQLHISYADIVQLVRKIFNSFNQLATIKNIDYQFIHQPDELRLWVDVSKIQSALRNLLSNAFKYTSPQDQIRIVLKQQTVDNNSYCTIEVIDTGIGIEEELQKRVFDSFITGKADPSMSTKVGIGLRIVKNTMDLHHGKVLLESNPGEGTKFILFIPEGKQHFAEDKYELEEEKDTAENINVTYLSLEQTEQPKKKSGKQILIIEDNDEMRQYIRSLFGKEYIVLEATDGQQGLDKAIEEEPDLIISDIMMPVKDGFTCCEELKSQLKTAHIPIILLTAKAEDADLLKSMRIGVDDYLMKPFNPEVLKIKVENLIRNREELKRIYTRTLLTVQNEPDEEDEKSLFMQKVITLIELNLTHPDFNAKSLAEKLNCSQPTLYRKIKLHTGLSIIEVIRSIRMSKAASYLMERKYSVQEVCEMVGYNDMNTFRKFFNKQFGVSPSRYVE
ncbi:signal transduction histidine kinase/DNA-binding response OmpR family regulator/ligand-binding sensor domain-containing protein [Parabacteroides sp. PM5-20]|uniref:hybrid sensor histidine kinase/response regulator transcription factor n=1 Tax=Parabacteroides sp. PM5-20 TaxID=2940527 RepID=UPI00247402EB|nr:two-component regulator propeller domain-containing protein [Parabacteroides sp. PM5-20]MDH6534109.1 signal transduction histidine kinase/DNA-binding response OmpR family regulator/ligand-binding sensor domain-containing protein [Parabacteroides sp. PM5-20]